MQCDVPILLILFNRPDKTKKVFNEIKKIKPKKLFIAVDGYRNLKEKKKCDEVQNIINEVGWDCEVKTLFQEKNLGVAVGPFTAISWFFENVDEGIILEDDCIPSSDFFIFCEKLLDKYRHDKRVMHISGNNFQKRKFGNGSYYFSNFTNSWGWATWKRAWANCDFEIDDEYNNIICNIFPNKHSKLFIKMIKKVLNNKIVAWDWRWNYSVWKKGGLSIIPNVNLVSNIGFGEYATNTNKKTSYMDLKTEKINDIIHPDFMGVNYLADNVLIKNIYKASLYTKIIYKLNKIKNRIKL